jgi:two-component system phosphate regulon response regulator PhoB
MGKATIAVIEDDPDIRELLSFSLAKEGWVLRFAEDGEKGLKMMSDNAPDCLVLDIMLPGMDGYEVLRRVKADPALRRVPVIMTTARGEEADVVSGLELGADDYVVKPYSPKILAARVRAALRRMEKAETGDGGGPEVLEISGLRLDPSRHEASFEGAEVSLSATEFAILEFLLGNPGRVFSRSQIIDAVKGRDYPVTDRSVDVQILSLRRKLGAGGEFIETVRGVGYRLKD